MKLDLNKIITILISYLATNITFADNLIDIYNLAKEQDPVLQAAYQEHKAQLEYLPQARATLLPTIIAGSGANKYSTTTDNVTSKYNTWNYGLKITQPLFQLSTWSKISQAKEQAKAAFANLAAAKQTLLFKTSQHYFAILKASDDLYFIKVEQNAVAKHLEQAKQRYKVGLIAITDVHEAQARYDSTYAKVLAAENALAASKEQLREIIGKEAPTLIGLKENLRLPAPQPANIQDWVQTATQNNWKLQAKRCALVIARQTIQEQRTLHLPTAQLEANLGKTKNAPGLPNKSTNKNIGININMPIFTGGVTLSKTRQAIYNYTKASKELEAQYRGVESNTRQAYRDIIVQLSKIKAYKQAVISNTSALTATQNAFEVGSRTVVDVLDAESALINAEKDYTKARYDYILQSLHLKQLTGALSIDDLQQINTWLKI